jgi:hypothetical protein
VCIGLRSIGASLSALVTAVLRDAGLTVRSLTLRPRGHPFDRHLAVADERRLSSTDAHHLVVDEGPGLSGSSFAAAARALAARGVPDEQIVLLPSWNADGRALLNPAARDHWSRHRRFVADFDGRAYAARSARELSGGAWRTLFYPAGGGPPVQPQHERRKLLDGARLHRFVGFGRCGRARLAWAQRLAAAGFQPPPTGVAHGFLVREFVAGQPLERIDGAVLDRVAAYLACRARFTVDEPLALEPLRDMAGTNIAELTELDARAALAARAQQAAAAQLRARTPAVQLDGRMQRHEWIAGARLWKVDAIDHGDDHFWPGPNDIAWDVAAALVELADDDAARQRLLAPLVAADATLPARLPFYELAYLAHRAGYARLAAQTLTDADGPRFARQAEAYRQRLVRALAG